MIREDLRKYIGEAMDNWCDDNNIIENREERFKETFLETVVKSMDIFNNYILNLIEIREPSFYYIVDNDRLYYLCKEIVKGE